MIARIRMIIVSFLTIMCCLNTHTASTDIDIKLKTLQHNLTLITKALPTITLKTVSLSREDKEMLEHIEKLIKVINDFDKTPTEKLETINTNIQEKKISTSDDLRTFIVQYLMLDTEQEQKFNAALANGFKDYSIQVQTASEKISQPLQALWHKLIAHNTLQAQVALGMIMSKTIAKAKLVLQRDVEQLQSDYADAQDIFELFKPNSSKDVAIYQELVDYMTGKKKIEVPPHFLLTRIRSKSF